MNDKRADFLWIVQMIMIKYQGTIVGWSGVAGDAVAASHRIPPELTARDAALAFCDFHVEGFSGQAPTDVPRWIASLSDPSDADYRRRGS